MQVVQVYDNMLNTQKAEILFQNKSSSDLQQPLQRIVSRRAKGRSGSGRQRGDVLKLDQTGAEKPKLDAEN